MSAPMRPRDRAKRLQPVLIKASRHALLPGDVQAALLELSALLGEWAELLESITPGNGGLQSQETPDGKATAQEAGPR